MNARVKSQRKQLFHILETEAQRASLSSEVGNTYNYYGKVVGGNSFKGWNVQFDLLPHNDNIIKQISQTKLVVVSPNEEEKKYDHHPPPNIVDGIVEESAGEDNNSEDYDSDAEDKVTDGKSETTSLKASSLKGSKGKKECC